MSENIGIYSITNLINQKRYIGSTNVLKRRKNEHFNKLRKNRHVNLYLQSAWNKYGEQNFSFDVIECINIQDDLLKREQYWIDKFKSNNRKYGYNYCEVAGTTLGYHHTEEFKKRLSKILSDKYKIIPHPRLNKSMPEEYKKRMSETRRGINHCNYGKHLSEETRRKLSEGRTGTKNWMYGKKQSDEIIKKRIEKTQGELHENAKLKNEDILKIRYLCEMGIPQHMIAKEFGVNQAHVSGIYNTKKWKHITNENYENKELYDKFKKEVDIMENQKTIGTVNIRITKMQGEILDKLVEIERELNPKNKRISKAIIIRKILDEKLSEINTEQQIKELL
jgi:group I intron endonuclease